MKRTNEAGYTLVSVLIIFLLFTIIGISLTTMSLSSVKASKTEQNHQSAFYIAEAGLNYKYHQLKDDFEKGNISNLSDLETKIDSMNNMPIVSFDDENKIDAKMVATGQETYADVMINPLPEISEYDFEIISTGHENNQTRTVKQTFVLDVEVPSGGGGNYELPPFAVFTSGDFEMNNGTIVGDIGTTNIKPGAISFPSGGPTLQGEVFVPDGNESIVSNKVEKLKVNVKPLDPDWKVPELPPFPEIPTDYPILPDRLAFNGDNSTYVIENGDLKVVNWITKNYELKLTQNVYFNSIILNENNKLYINTDSTNIDIVVNHLNLINGHIVLKGEGKLTIYVKDKITMGSGSTINENGNVDQVNIFLQGSENPSIPKSVKLRGSQKIYGSLYAEDADIDLGAGGGFTGNIFTGGKSFKIGGGSTNKTQLFFAPNAHFDMSGGGKRFEGMIIADTFEVGGGWNIIRKDFDFTDGPISPAALGIGNEGGSGGGLEQPPGQIQPGHANMEPTSSLTEINE